MLPIHTILHPTDFSERAHFAFQLACSLARDHGAKLIVVHVTPPQVYYGELVPLPPADCRDQVWQEFHRVEAMEPWVRELRLETRSYEGDPSTRIVEAARELGAELIVMGNHGRTGLSRLLMGSVAEEVVRRADCPVLTVKAPFPVEGAAVPEHEEVPALAGM